MSQHPNLADAVARWGALAVHDAIFAAMGGDHRQLLSMGFDGLTLQGLWALAQDTHSLLTPDEQAANEARTAIDLARVRKPGRPRKPAAEKASERFEVWLTPRQREELRRRGDTAAVKAWLDGPEPSGSTITGPDGR